MKYVIQELSHERKKKKIKRGDLPEAQLKALYNCC
jgi:hypothetical protein